MIEEEIVAKARQIIREGQPVTDELMARAQELFLLVVERLGEYMGEWWTVEVDGAEVAVVRR